MSHLGLEDRQLSCYYDEMRRITACCDSSGQVRLDFLSEMKSPVPRLAVSVHEETHQKLFLDSSLGLFARVLTASPYVMKDYLTESSSGRPRCL